MLKYISPPDLIGSSVVRAYRGLELIAKKRYQRDQHKIAGRCVVFLLRIADSFFP